MTQVTDAMVEVALDAFIRDRSWRVSWFTSSIATVKEDMRAALEAALAVGAEENPTVSAWPIGCHDPTSCGERHRQCMYLKCRHEGRDITSEIDAAIRALSDRS